MLQSILANIEEILTKYDFTLKIKDDLLTYLKLYKKGNWIYPGVIKRKYNLAIKDVYLLLDDFEKEGIIEKNYELYCSNCQKSSGIVVQTLNELPETFICDMCENELHAIENVVIIYRVLKDE